MSVTSIPDTCRAATLTEFGTPLELAEVRVPRELEPGGLLVRVEVATICGSDVHLCDGSLLGAAPRLPVIPGHEFVGQIAAFGSGPHADSVGTPLEIGDRIVWTHGACRSCYACEVLREPSLCTNRRLYMSHPTDDYPFLAGGFAEYCYVFPQSGRLRVPDAVQSDWASASSCALRTIMKAFNRLGAIRPGERVVIQGAGPLGLFATAVARTAGAERIIVVGAPNARLDVARAWGADDVISVEGSDADARAREVLDATDGRGAEIVFELSGAPGAFVEGLAYASRGARYVVVGQLGPNRDAIETSLITRKQLSVLGSYSGHTAEYWQALRFIESHRADFDWDLMLSNRYTLDDVNTAMDRMRSFDEIKAVVAPTAA